MYVCTLCVCIYFSKTRYRPCKSNSFVWNSCLVDMLLLRPFRVLEVIYMQMLPILMFGSVRSFLLNFPLTKLVQPCERGSCRCFQFATAGSANGWQAYELCATGSFLLTVHLPSSRLSFLYQRAKVRFQITTPMTRCIASNIYYFLRGLLWVVSMNRLGHMTIYVLSTPVLFFFSELEYIFVVVYLCHVCTYEHAISSTLTILLCSLVMFSIVLVFFFETDLVMFIVYVHMCQRYLPGQRMRLRL